ncbi:MAG: sulfonate transport system substrate-binding protein [Hyphomicrobiales bacterium]|jgi:NitT/TauT family transport system substrate-binding protein|nr:sulfonate transport system substrate-binding protein [Hyphomicrobiales bacterium]
MNLKILRCLVVAAAVAAIFSESPARAAKKITITIGGEAMHYFPVYIARAAGFFAAEGLEVDWVQVNSGARQVASIRDGSADVTPDSLGNVIKAAGGGGGMIALMSVFDVVALPLVLSREAIDQTGITSALPVDEKIKRLRGLRFCITSPGSSTDTFIRSLFVARGMNPDIEVKLLPMGAGGSILAAFENKLCDGFVYPSPIPEIAKLRGLGDTIIDPFNGDVSEIVGVPYVVLATSPQTLATKPDLVLAAVRAVTKALTFTHEKPEEARKLMRQYFPEIEQSVFDLAVEAYRKATPKEPTITESKFLKTLAWLNIGLAKPMVVPYETAVVNGPVEQILKELGHR